MTTKKHVIRAIGIATTTVALTLTMSNSAQAIPYSAECSTTGAWAKVSTDRDGADDRVDFVINFSDTLADGHHARARLVTKDVNGIIKRWQWHKDTDGSNNGNVRYASYAINSSGIFSVGIDAARFEGDTLLNACTKFGA
ncbi:hypothetical protein ABZS61_26980 [Streptomyces sp. NPDC005566]|uniref:hypothetical protein n=1 Tax=Streptomyces sp. NPDC005566 TaxID=3156886 RepID=UPI0033B6545E